MVVMIQGFLCWDPVELSLQPSNVFLPSTPSCIFWPGFNYLTLIISYHAAINTKITGPHCTGCCTNKVVNISVFCW